MSFSGSDNIKKTNDNIVDTKRHHNRPGIDTTEQQPVVTGLNTLSLPKGGGAISGIGEKFETNPITGTASVVVPIAISAGRSGFSPRLSLTYDSGSENGAFGLGWSLSLPSITRKTSKGIPKYQDIYESDVFILSGAEDLVPVYSKSDDGNWLKDEEGNFIIEEQERDGYLVKLYRPRIEGLFARIERWTSLHTGETHWRSISKDNITTLYGLSANSRISDPTNLTHIFSWLICQSYDDKGNAIIYEYKEENSERIDLSYLNEENRTSYTRGVNRYLKRIKYGNKTPYNIDEDITTRNDWLFEVVFDYGEYYSEDHLDPNIVDVSYDGVRKWFIRKDPFSRYRSGFEIRTYRLCQRILMFHHFPDELGTDNYLVSSTDITYDEDLSFTFISKVSRSGYIRKDDGRYQRKSFPPIVLEYSPRTIHGEIKCIDTKSLENLPLGLDQSNFQWVDLDGEGISGILTEQGGSWFYKRNLSALPVKKNDELVVEPFFGPLEKVVSLPSLADIRSGRQQFLDLAGDGQLDLVSLNSSQSGFFERTKDEKWESFIPFLSIPNISWNDPNLKFVDLTGDGLADLLITGDQVFFWHQSLAEKGFATAEKVKQYLDENEGPRLVFADSIESVFLADMSGDGMTDLVRIRNDEVCYWPNLGYGRFGSKVTMDNPPLFDQLDIFHQKRILLADVDGSGVTDIIYFGSDGIRLYYNQSGNSWSEKQHIGSFPSADNQTTVTVVDLLGTGTACLVWSSFLPSNVQSSMRFIDLMGGKKPHLLIKITNNFGGETRIQFAPSTKFYLSDKVSGKPWITKLPFPVHVVERVEALDYVSQIRFSTNYVYHHGYFDSFEREFRGFGMVEQVDCESFEDFVRGVTRVEGIQELVPELNQAPVTTYTWFHTGAFIDLNKILHQFREEYYEKNQYLPEPELPTGLNTEELRECLRALKGLPLRKEIYSDDGSIDAIVPYLVVENNYNVILSQLRGLNRHAVFYTVGTESISMNYERSPHDPRISHNLTLETDDLGNVLKSCSIMYGRKISDASLPVEVTRDQLKMNIIYSEIDYTYDIIQENPKCIYLLRVPYESRSYEVTGIRPNSSIFKLSEIKMEIAKTIDISYGTIADTDLPQKRLISHNRTLFLDNNLNPMALGQWDSLGLIYESYKLAFTPDVLGSYYGDRILNSDFIEAGYVHFEGDSNWWVPSGRPIYPSAPSSHFFIPIGTKDPMGMERLADFDQYDLLVESVNIKQAAWNKVIAVNDYRILAPVMTTDPNHNRIVIEVDALCMVTKSAVMGKVGAGEGDSIADPTVRMEYDLFNWINHHKPNFVHLLEREQHGGTNLRWQESYVYSNGRGGVEMSKVRVHPGKAIKVDFNGTISEVDADPRWIGNGRVVLNNKGNPIKQYEPYFSVTHECDNEKQLREIGITPILFYDPIGRNIRTDFPNGSFSKVEFNPWMQKIFDVNDTVKDSQWYKDRGNPDPITQPEPLADLDKRAAWLTAKHADTPGIVHVDNLGRPILAISDYGEGKTTKVRSESDFTGRISKLFDQEQREVTSGFASMIGTSIYVESAEKGRRWSFYDVLGSLVRTWDEYGREFSIEYDPLHRPVSTFVKELGESEIVSSYIVYGDRNPNAQQLNLLGMAHQIFDQAGMVRISESDFKGNPKVVDRILSRDYKKKLDWNMLIDQPDYSSVQNAAAPVLETEEFTTTSEYDALNRLSQVTLPDRTLIVPTYNQSNILASLQVQISGQGPLVDFLNDQDYDAKGRRLFARYGNGIVSRYFYDPKTSRLNNLVTYEPSRNPETEGLQNLRYYHDPVGNITAIRDDAQQTRYFNNTVVKPENLFEYDALYQLIKASGREHAGLTNDSILDHRDLGFRPQLPHENNKSAVRTYTEEYEYDLLGNIKSLTHHFKTQSGIGNGWKRLYRYAYEDDHANRTNRLVSTRLPGDSDEGPFSATYDYDQYGNMISMPHLANLEWNFMDQLQQVDLGGGGVAYYVYGVSGKRIRKVIERLGTTRSERIYLGGLEFYRERVGNNAPHFERQTIFISDNTGRIAQVDTKTKDDKNIDPANNLNEPLIRYQYSNHLGSAVLETDAEGRVISYEEYHPYGTTAYHSAKSGFDLSLKKYRFSSKERDNETGLYYFGARYYPAWLGRWVSSDPIGIAGGINFFSYCLNNPVNVYDPNGTDGRWRTDRRSLGEKDPETHTPIDTLPEFERWAVRHGIEYEGTPTFGAGTWHVTRWRQVEEGHGGPASNTAAAPAPSRPAITAVQEAARPSAATTPNQVGRTRVGEPRSFPPGEPIPGPYNTWSNETGGGLKSAARSPGFIMEDTAFEEAAEAAARSRGYTGRYDPRITQQHFREIWYPASESLATRAGLSQMGVEAHGIDPASIARNPGYDPSKSVQVSREIPRIRAAGGAMAGLGVASGGLMLYSASQVENPAVRYFGYAAGGAEIAGSLRYAQGLMMYGNTPGSAIVMSQGAGLARFGGGAGMVVLSGYALVNDIQNGNYGVTLGDTAGIVSGGAVLAGSGPVAAIAGGVQLSNMAGNWVEEKVTSSTGSRTAGVGAGTAAGAGVGAAAGAAIGVWFFGVGAAPGALIGGAVGAVSGFIGSFW